MDEPLESRIKRLSPGQRECLELVAEHLSSKQIAVKLGISSHTVDQRIRQAIHTLGVERRGEAVRLLIGTVPPSPPDANEAAYQPLIHQSPHIDPDPAPDQSDGAVSYLIRHADRAGETGSPGIISEQIPGGRSPLQMPFATRSQPANEMNVAMRLLWIILIALGAAFSVGMYLAGLESLSRMIAD